MTKSRTLPALLLLAMTWPVAALAQSDQAHEAAPTIVTAEEALAMNRAQLRDLVSRNCPQGALADEVVVCGRREGLSRYRVPSADPDLAAGLRQRAGGAQLAAMEAGGTRCSAVGRDQLCGGGVDVIGVGFMIVRGIVQALANRD